MKPFLLLATRDHDEAADREYDSILRHAGLDRASLNRVRVEAEPLPAIDLDAYAGVFLGGSAFTISDTDKTDLQRRVEADLSQLIDRIVDADVPFFGMCYGVGTIVTHLGGVVDRTYGEPISAPRITVTEDGAADPLLAGMPSTFHAFVGHKEACNGNPPGATLLATGQACPVQMFRVGRNVYVTQFHPELDADDLITRMRIYQHAGYFRPDELEPLIEMARTSPVNGAQHRLLRNFVERYAS